MHIDSMFPTQYIKAADLQGRDTPLMITKCEIEVIDKDKNEAKPVVCFHETEQKLVLNKTNAMTISTIYGAETDHWVGKAIVLYPTTCMVGSDRKDCIRVRETAPRAAMPTQLPPPVPQPVSPQPFQQQSLPQQPVQHPQQLPPYQFSQQPMQPSYGYPAPGQMSQNPPPIPPQHG